MMLDIALITGVMDPLDREREHLERARRRADRAGWLAWGGFCGTLLFVMILGVIA